METSSALLGSLNGDTWNTSVASLDQTLVNAGSSALQAVSLSGVLGALGDGGSESLETGLDASLDWLGRAFTASLLPLLADCYFGDLYDLSPFAAVTDLL